VTPIRIVPLGRAERSVIETLRDGLATSLRSPVEIAGCPFDLERVYDPSRLQYNSSRIIQGLAELRCPGDAGTKVVAVVAEDLFIPILTYVFGEAQLGGAYSVVSTHRLRNALYGLPPAPALEDERLLKEALHELGHTFGLLHCQRQDCVMRASTTVDDIDIKGIFYCPACLAAADPVRGSDRPPSARER
jgi:archaemetzincin